MAPVKTTAACVGFTGRMGNGLHGLSGLPHTVAGHFSLGLAKHPRDVVTAAVVTLSPTAQECMWRARLEAQHMGSAEVQPGHVLLGCLKVGGAACSAQHPSSAEGGVQSVAVQDLAEQEVRAVTCIFSDMLCCFPTDTDIWFTNMGPFSHIVHLASQSHVLSFFSYCTYTYSAHRWILAQGLWQCCRGVE
jgi:hypothetical protein